MNKSSKFEAAREWFLDSLHDHITDAVKLAALAFFAHGDDLLAVFCAAGAMLLSLVGLIVAQKMVETHKEHKTAHTSMTYNEVVFEAEFVAMIREREASR